MQDKSTHASLVSVGQSTDAVVIMIDGRGLRRESEAIKSVFDDIADHDPDGRLVLVLNQCDYLDSTFLGSLVQMNKRIRGRARLNLQIVASRESTERLFGPSKLQHYLPIETDVDLKMPSDWKILDIDRHSSDCMYHQLDAHECLGELDIPQADAFRRIAAGIRRDLQSRDM